VAARGDPSSRGRGACPPPRALASRLPSWLALTPETYSSPPCATAQPHVLCHRPQQRQQRLQRMHESREPVQRLQRMPTPRGETQGAISLTSLWSSTPHTRSGQHRHRRRQSARAQAACLLSVRHSYDAPRIPPASRSGSRASRCSSIRRPIQRSSPTRPARWRRVPSGSACLRRSCRRARC
jgi:hypothetical protein